MISSIEELKNRIAYLKHSNFEHNYAEKVLNQWFPERLGLKPSTSTPPKLAGVQILIYPRKEELYIALMQRDHYPGVHSNQISLPGGKQEISDVDLWETAKRETFEEFGVKIEDKTPLWKLSDVFIPPSNFLVSPYLSVLPLRPDFNTNYEVKQLIELPLSAFFEDKNIKKGPKSISKDKEIITRYFQIENHIIWGATALILGELRILLSQDLKK